MSPLYIPVVAQPGQISALPGEDAVVGMNKLAEDKKYVYPHLFTSTFSDFDVIFLRAAGIIPTRCVFLLILVCV